MIRRRRDQIVFLIASIVIPILALKVALYSYASSEQHKAERLLDLSRTVHIRVTSASDFQSKLHALDPDFTENCTGGKYQNRGGMNYSTQPPWRILQGGWPAKWHPWLLPRYTTFGVSFECSSDVITELLITEQQVDYSRGTTYTGAALLQGAEMVSPHEAAYGHAEWITDPGRSQNTVYIPPNAPAPERERALAFHVDCFTRHGGCQNADAILDSRNQWAISPEPPAIRGVESATISD